MRTLVVVALLMILVGCKAPVTETKEDSRAPVVVVLPPHVDIPEVVDSTPAPIVEAPDEEESIAIVDAPEESPAPVVNECAGDFMVGSWTTPNDVSEVWDFNADCTGHNYKCDFDFTFPKAGSAGWVDDLHFNIVYTSEPDASLPGCEQYQAHSQVGQGHTCYYAPTGLDNTRLDCNAEVNAYYFDRE